MAVTKESPVDGAGRYGARCNTTLLTVAVLMTAAGIFAVAASKNAAVVLTAMAVFGGYGVALTAALVVAAVVPARRLTTN